MVKQIFTHKIALLLLLCLLLMIPVQIHDGVNRDHQQQAEQQQQGDLVGDYLFDHGASPCW